jgi:hypothetical protein
MTTVKITLLNSHNLINAYTKHSNEQFNQSNPLSSVLINTIDNEIFLINESLCDPLLHIGNKLLGRQNLNFEQLTPPEQALSNRFESHL